MIERPEDRLPPLTPQLALRVAVVGSIALAMFAIVFFRLWFLQVLSGQQYLAQASTNQVRNLRIAAPRGEIVDRTGTVLVDSKAAMAVEISGADLPVSLQKADPTHPPRQDKAIYRRLAKVLGMSNRPQKCVVDKPANGVNVYSTYRLAPIACLVAQRLSLVPFQAVTIKWPVSQYVQFYLAERQDQFPGVEVDKIWLRTYPLHDTAAQLFGTVGPITKTEVGTPRYRGVSQQAIVGQSGLEWYYNKDLSGVDGSDQVQVDAFGHLQHLIKENLPSQGHTLKLTLDIGLQKAAQQALADAIANNPPAGAGAFVAMNPRNGDIYAMGSYPTFDPNVFTHTITKSQYDSKFGQNAGYPLLDRAIQSAYPTGSTFKGISATAALQSGRWGLTDTYDDTGVYTNGPTDTRHNAGHAVYGTLDLQSAIQFSSDDFFYNLGARMNVDVPQGGPLQQWARNFGIGHTTGIDLGGEVSGILPSPEWRTQRDAEEVAYEHKHHVPCCTLSDKRPWSVGDNENLAVGQGDLEATPLQLGVAYSAIENGGTVVTPHVGMEVDAPDGSLVRTISPPPVHHWPIASQNLQLVQAGLHAAASQAGGTSADVFAGWPQSQFPVYGKTGTAERPPQADQSWYVCYVPDPSRPILVVVTVEQGGFGAQAAAPAAREILSQWFFGKRGKFVAGTSKTL